MRRLVLAVVVVTVVAGWVATPPHGKASCARTASLEEVAREPGTGIFTGQATDTIPGTLDVVFAVDRWFTGPHAARMVRLLGSSAMLGEPPAAGVVQVTLANVVAGDAITLVRGEPVLIVATWTAEGSGFGVRFCSVAGVPLDTPEGREALRTAVAIFGPGAAAADLPATDALGPGAGNVATAPFRMRDWWPLVLAFALAAGVVLVSHRARRPRSGARD